VTDDYRVTRTVTEEVTMTIKNMNTPEGAIAEAIEENFITAVGTHSVEYSATIIKWSELD
jgi:hypothetical protein